MSAGALTIRDARADERPSLDELHLRSSLIWEEDRGALLANPDALGVAPERIAEGRVRVAAAQDGRLLGFSVALAGEAGSWVLEDLFVAPEEMRRGVGRALVEDALERAVAEGAARMTVVAHRRNFPFYESVRFVPGEAVATRFGPAVQMSRELP